MRRGRKFAGMENEVKNVIVFLEKELMESIRNYKLLILAIIFVLFGVLSPLSAKFLPEIMESFLPQGIEITLAQPTEADAWLQFFKNTSQISLIIIIVLNFAAVSKEYEDKTLINVLTKGVSGKSVIGGKFISSALQITVCYWLSFLICLFYSSIYLVKIDRGSLFLAAMSQNLFLIMWLAVMLFFSSCTGHGYISLICTGGLVVVLNVANLFPNLKKVNPIVLLNDGMSIMNKEIQGIKLYGPVCAALILMILALFLANYMLKKNISKY